MIMSLFSIPFLLNMLKGRLFVVCVDFQNFFDCLNRDAFMYKLLNMFKERYIRKGL